jgi:predicted MFS family arabinose efflux permease
MIAMAAAMGIGRFVYTPILPGMMDGLGLSASDAGLLASANYLGYLLGAIAAAGGWAQGRERPLVLIGMALNALLAAAMGLTTALDVFLVIRFAAGVVSAFVMVFQTTIVFARLAATGRTGLQAIHFAGVGVGIAISGLMTGFLHMANASWQQGWLWAGAISAIGFVLVLALAEPRGSPVSEPGHEPPLPKERGLYSVILAYGLFGFGYIVTATFLVAIVRQGEADRLFESVVWMATGLAGIPSLWLWSTFARRRGLVTAFVVASVVEGVGVLASVTLGSTGGPLLGGVLLGFTFIAITAMGLQIGRQMAPRAPRRALAVMTAAFGIGQILGPIVAGYAADITGSFVAGSIAATIALFFSCSLIWSTRTMALRPA